ncbi:phosphotransferase [Leucothrix mucor]|uniref:phosphotransferase n=1 Tax=Leucothrix mucor TaxID=45248 RepID=UPI0003B6851C|nr:phosphotransferase [Leucothrix mucor]
MNPNIDPHLATIILNATGASELSLAGTIQNLWSGYGSIDRYRLTGGEQASVIVKHVRLPKRSEHPRGWNTNLSHQRKLRSYQVETAWYAQWAARCNEDCRVPHCLSLEQRDDEFLMVMEDLDDSGYPARREQASLAEINVCLHWLANFHATFLGEKPQGLWETGTYWHLETRPDELAALPEGALKQAAASFDQRLKDASFQTLVHGDAKLANFCFSEDGTEVAAVDFQYVGGGCGMKDVAYFIGSCLDEHDCERLEGQLLDTYFAALNTALAKHQSTINPQAVEAAWRPLYAVAWSDFYRFLQGWSPGHWKIHSYSERLANEVIST